MKCLLYASLPEDVKTEVEDAIISVTIVVTFTTGYAGSESSTKYFMNPCSFGKFGINFSERSQNPVIESKISDSRRISS